MNKRRIFANRNDARNWGFFWKSTFKESTWVMDHTSWLCRSIHLGSLEFWWSPGGDFAGTVIRFFGTMWILAFILSLIFQSTTGILITIVPMILVTVIALACI